MMPSSRDSITSWIAGAKEGEKQARENLYRRYYQAMVRLASALSTIPHHASDPEAVADDAFLNFTERLDRSGFGELLNRKDLWQILGHLVKTRAADQAKYQKRQVRDVGRTNNEAAFDEQEDSASVFSSLSDPQLPDPADGVAWQEEYRRLLGMLSPRQRNIVVLKEAGFLSSDIADKFRCSIRTVERELAAIRSTFAQNGFQPPFDGKPIIADEG